MLLPSVQHDSAYSQAIIRHRLKILLESKQFTTNTLLVTNDSYIFQPVPDDILLISENV